MGSRRRNLVLALVAVLALAPAADGRTRHRSGHHRHRAAVTDPAACPLGRTFDDALAALRACDQVQLDHLFTGLGAGPMPAYGSVSRGYWRWDPSAQGADMPLNVAFDQVIWQGKVFYTHRNGGIVFNRAPAGRQLFSGAVYYGPGQLDGRRSIVVDYSGTGDRFMDFWFRDEMREVRPGLFLGFGWWNMKPSTADPAPPSLNRVTFILDFHHPDIPAAECVSCAAADAVVGPGHP